MSFPAALPALALSAGIAAGVLLLPMSVFILFMTSLLLLASVSWAVVAFVYGRTHAVVAFSACGFFAAGMSLGAGSNQQALRTPMGELFRQQTRGGAFDLFAIVQGRLRQDASASASGINLSVAVDHLDLGGLAGLGRREYKTAGGVLVGVDGTLGRDRLAAWRAGRVIRFPATLRRPAKYFDPGVPDAEGALAWRGTTLVGSVKSPALIELIGRGTWLSEAMASVRAHLRENIAASVAPWSARSAAVVAAILIGDRTGLDDEVEERLQKAGTYHVIAISGGNIAIFAALFLALFRAVRIGPRASSLIVIVLLSLYALVVGGGSSVTRATMMAVVYLAADLRDLRTPPANAVAVAGAVLLVAAPLAIVDAGFMLTFGATLGILFGVPIVTQPVLRAKLLRVPFVLLAASMCAEAALLPVSAYVFSRVTFAGLLLNVAAIPLMTLVQVTGMAAVALASLGGHGARSVGYLAHLGVTGLLDSAALVDRAPWLAWRVPPPPAAVIVGYYAALIACVIAHANAQRGSAQHRRWVVVRALGGAITIGCGAWVTSAPVFASRRQEMLRVTFVDVGQGDAEAIRFPDGRSLTIDAGGVPGGSFDIGSRVVSPTLWAMGFRELDYMALTHGDFDHIGGARAVFDDFHPAEIWEGVPVPPHKPMQALRQLADGAGTAWRTLQPGDRVHFGSAQLAVWHPPSPDWERQRVRNDDSVVIEITLGDVSFVFTGDIGAEAERVLTPRFSRAGIRVLKVPHHGSATSSSAEFVRSLHPDVAVISDGRGNSFGHPVPAVVRRYQDIGAAMYRTDQDGAVMMETDGETLRIQTFLGRKLTLRAH